MSIAASGVAEDGCLKRVFNEYCLGGDINQLLRQKPSPLLREQQGDRYAVIYADGRDRIYVLSYRARIYKIVRRYNVATLIKYRELLGILERKYGKSRDRSEFPDYAQSSASRIGAIRRGDGMARHLWRPKDATWHVELSWTREMGMALAYIDDDLAAQQQQTMEQGY